MTLSAFAFWLVFPISTVACVGLVFVWWAIRSRDMQYWLPSYVLPRDPSGRRDLPLADDETVHVFIGVCDHFEPEFAKPSKQASCERVRRWTEDYPRLFGQFRDAGGRPPQWTFFFPEEEYAPEYLDPLARLCDAGYGDVEIHLHHDNDTADAVRETLERFKETLYYRHGLLRQDPATGEIAYGFIHGNWALCNARPDGRWCGVNDELTILKETGCYADFTMPSAPSPTQTRTINSIYYARDVGGRPKSHDNGIRSRAGRTSPGDHLLMIQGPLLLDWESRKWGLIPRIENGDLHTGRPATWRRMQLWLRAGVHVAGRPNWKFIKLHTHGCNDANANTLLSPEMQQFHRDLAAHAAENPRFRYHYVTAWEMAQLVRQAESGAREPILVDQTPSIST
jgi:hypothetical protein